MSKKIIFLLVVVPLVVILDQVTKVQILNHFSLHESKDIIPGLFSLTYVRNPGAAFGFLRDAPENFKNIFFLALTPIMLIFLGGILVSLKKEKTFQILAVCSIVGGAIGNYIDRIRFNYVVDFLDFCYKNWHYPAFNVADMAIVCGVLSLLVLTFFEDMRNKKNK